MVLGRIIVRTHQQVTASHRPIIRVQQRVKGAQVPLALQRLQSYRVFVYCPGKARGCQIHVGSPSLWILPTEQEQHKGTLLVLPPVPCTWHTCKHTHEHVDTCKHMYANGADKWTCVHAPPHHTHTYVCTQCAYVTLLLSNTKLQVQIQGGYTNVLPWVKSPPRHLGKQLPTGCCKVNTRAHTQAIVSSGQVYSRGRKDTHTAFGET